MKVAGWEVWVDPQVPPDEVWFFDGKILVGRITGLRLPTWRERLWAWLTRRRSVTGGEASKVQG